MTLVPKDHNQQIAELPDSVADIAQTFGLKLVFLLVEHFAGVELRIPHTLKPDHKLMVLGEENARLLCDYCPTDTILVPMSLNRAHLAAKVALLESHGVKRWKIARELGITQRHVRRLANSEPSNSNQIDFFIDHEEDDAA